jgi:thiamine pyrophosphokinase
MLPLSGLKTTTGQNLMSSHHIIRDEQEPVLFVLAASNPDFTLVEQLLEWSPVVVVSEASLQLALDWGIKIDKVICQADQQARCAAQLAHQMPVEILVGASDLPGGPFAQWLVAKQLAANVLLPLGPASLPELRTQWLALAKQVPLVFYGNGWKGFLLTQPFKKWVTAGTRFVLEQPVLVLGLCPAPEGWPWWVGAQTGIVEIHPYEPIFVLEQLV